MWYGKFTAVEIVAMERIVSFKFIIRISGDNEERAVEVPCIICYSHDEEVIYTVDEENNVVK